VLVLTSICSALMCHIVSWCYNIYILVICELCSYNEWILFLQCLVFIMCSIFVCIKIVKVLSFIPNIVTFLELDLQTSISMYMNFI